MKGFHFGCGSRAFDGVIGSFLDLAYCDVCIIGALVQIFICVFSALHIYLDATS